MKNTMKTVILLVFVSVLSSQIKGIKGGNGPYLDLNGLDTLKSEAYLGSTSLEQFTIANIGDEALTYGMAVNYILSKNAKDSGGPDGGDYIWKDSDEQDGPDYNWVEISGVGTPLSLGDEEMSDPLPIGFNFYYYGNVYNTINVCSDGYLSFTSDFVEYDNKHMPNFDDPNNVLAVLWSDLDPDSGGEIYYYYDDVSETFIIQYESIRQYWWTEEFTLENTFEVILHKNGYITFQYKSVNMDLGNVYTVGVENDDGTLGTEVVCDQSYLKSDLAIVFKPTIKWLSLSSYSGSVLPSGSDQINATFNTANLIEGLYNAEISLTTNDPNYANVTVPVEFRVLPIPIPSNVLPVNSSLTTDLTPTFDWSDVSAATSYTLLVDNNSDFSSPEINQSPTVSNYTPGSNLATGTYFWKVRSNVLAASGDYSFVWTVQLGNLPSVPTLALPVNASQTTDLTPTFDWGDVSDAASYTLLVDNNSDFSSPEINQSPTASNYTPDTDLPAATYYWKVLATNPFGSSAYTSVWTVTLQIIPDIPSNIVTSVTGSDILINWDDSADATSYDIYSSADPYGTYSFLTNVSVSQYTYTPSGSKMFFYIVAKNSTKESSETLNNIK